MDEKPLITLTDDALANALRLQQETDGWRGLPLRVYIEGKGCDGFYYGVSFDAAAKDDVTWTQGALTLVIDKPSLQFLEGATVTWVDDERGTGFLVENPHHKRYRGKFYKKKAWQEALTSSSR